MRLRDENKRKAIIATATRLFAERPFHKVRLDDVAEEAGIGKGTVYIYFKNKEELYYSLVYDGFADLVQRMNESLAAQINHNGDRIRVLVRGLVDFAVQHPQLWEVMRTVGVPEAASKWDVKRQEYALLVETVIRNGVATGEFADDHPDYTALYLMATVRAVMSYRPGEAEPETLSRHISSIMLRGIEKNGA